MRLSGLLTSLLVLATRIPASAASNADVNANANTNAEAAEEIDLHNLVPSPLTISDFDNALSEGFHMVEFFSPYCPHCTHLFPTWAKFHLQSKGLYENGEVIDTDDTEHVTKYGVHQVDCVTSGDLCDREGVQYYPMIRFYGPGSQLLGSMLSSDRTIDTLKEFAEEQLLAWSDDYDVSDVQKLGRNSKLYNENRMIGSDEMIKLIAGESKVPTVVSFWPTTHEQLNDKNFQDTFAKHPIFKQYENLFMFRNLWNLVMKGVNKFVEEDKLRFSYFNCASDPKICDAVGFTDMSDGRYLDRKSPRVVMYLPKAGGNAIYNKQNFGKATSLNAAVKSLSHWIITTLANSQVKDLPFRDIVNFIGGTKRLNQKGGVVEFTDYSKVAFIQVNDPETHVPEDDVLMDHLIQSVADLSNDVFLFQTSDKDGVAKFLLDQEKFLADQYIHYNVPEEAETAASNDGAEKGDKNKDGKKKAIVKFDEHMFVSRTHTTYPFFICVKAGSLYTPVHQSFMSKDTRDYSKIIKFIKKNHLPAVNHLTLENERRLFPNKVASTIHDKTEKMIIALTDFQTKQFFDVEFFLSFVYHKFTYLNNKFKFDKLLGKREDKHKNVKKLKDANAISDDIIDALRQKIDVNFESTENAIYPVYIDTKQFSKIISTLGWNNIHSKGFSAGDVLIVERFSGHYWTEDLHGEKLTIDKHQECVETLESISFDNLRGKNLRSKSILLSILHYSVIAAVALTFLRVFKRWRLRTIAHKEKLKGLGILGVNPDHNDSKFD